MELGEAYATLGLRPGAPPDAVARAYRALAKAWHPDLRGDASAIARMVELNAAHDRIRAAQSDGTAPRATAAPGTAPRPSGPGAWLSEAMRRRLGGELVRALARDEPVVLVTEAATWKSPRAVLVLTDRRLLWLNDDAVVNRVRTLGFDDVKHVESRLSWPLRRLATVKLRTHAGRRVGFAELEPAVAGRIIDAIRVADARLR